ncbi:unnamed protein product [Diatraea saccharalis]|uniref:ascorbate ferrireductase (transmembrane) n=1 Tax=Diatraea saccharalis TaxID=40085 RepID=A0A9P0G1N8_9NEOP|nr:unnamed protein product [Diatraea saccharalis]
MLCYRESKADTACKLECLQDKPPVHEFVGPVKIVLMDVPTNVYKRKMWLAALVGMAKLFMGATLITVLYFALAMKTALMPTLHIILCTFGYQLFIPVGILMMSNLHGPSSQMKSKDRRKHHFIIQVIGLICALAGSALSFLHNGTLKLILTPHSIAGLTAAGFAGLSLTSGPFLFCKIERGDVFNCFKSVHVLFGVPTMLASSVCFCLGLYFSKIYNEWAPIKEMVFIPIIFCALYTFIIIYKPIKKIYKPDVL